MSSPSMNPTPRGTLGSDPGPSVRRWVALLLRLGIGLSLLNTGLAGYIGAARGGPGMNAGMPGIAPPGMEALFSALPYVTIALGLALILGFLTTASAVASGFYSLMTPLFMTIRIVSSGAAIGWPNPAGGLGDPFLGMLMMTTGLTGLLPQAALIWLSPLENHPYSIDALIYGRKAMPAPEASPAWADPTDPEAPLMRVD